MCEKATGPCCSASGGHGGVVVFPTLAEAEKEVKLLKK